MSSLLALPFRPVLNQNGQFEAGAVMTVYKQGTTTLEPLFSDEAKLVPLSNPLTADGYGVFPAVYWNDTQEIRVQIAESNGTVLFDLDPYVSTVFDAEAILEQASAQSAAAASSAMDAETAKIACQTIEGTVEALVGPAYADTTAGIAATIDGEFFAVVDGDVISIYLNDTETAVLQRSILSATAVESALAGKAALVHVHVISDVTGLQTALDAKATLASPALTGTPTAGGIEIGYRSIPVSSTTTTAVVADRGKCISVNAGITVPASIFAAGDAISIYNNSASSVTVTQGVGLTLRQASTANTGNRTLAQRGIATVWFLTATEAIISGAGVT